MTNSICTLCSAPILNNFIHEEEKRFCCHGCHAVYNILESASALEGFESHPVFKQAVKFGLISNPKLIEQLHRKEENLEKRKWQLEIQNMWCFSCSDLIQLILLRNKGVASCIVDYATDLACIEYYPQMVSKEKIAAVIESLGYLPKELSAQLTLPKNLHKRFLLAAFCALNVMMFAYPLYAIYFSFEMEGLGELFAQLSFGFSLPVVTYCAYPIYKRCILGLKAGLLGMEALVTLGTLAAFGLSLYEMWLGTNNVYFDSMTVIVALVLLGKIIEGRAKFSSKEMLFRLHRSVPQKARKFGDDKLVSLKQISIGDLLLAHSGEKIVLDGVIVSGEGACDESLITGESLPVLKKKDDEVVAGALVQSGSITYRVASLSEKSSLQKIITLIEQDIGKKKDHYSLADKLASLFTPFVLLLAIVTWLFEGATASIAVLLISCPCAIGIAAPLAESHLIAGLAELGAIVRNRNILGYLGNKAIYIFDKTGTVTEGKFRVVSGLECIENLSILKTMTAFSAHPLCYAIHQAISDEEQACSKIEEIPGRGMRAVFEGSEYFLGSSRFLKEQGLTVPTIDAPLTSVFFAKKDGKVTEICLEDQVRNEAKKLSTSLEGKKILLSGDNAKIVEKVAKELNFDDWHAGVTPLEKKVFIEKLKEKGHTVFMIGDGINDAAAIASADIGATVVSASDISIQVSDILLTNKIDILPQLIILGKKGRKILKQNFFWAFFYNIVGIGLAALGHLTPVFSAVAMTASSVMVLFNSRRISKN